MIFGQLPQILSKSLRGQWKFTIFEVWFVIFLIWQEMYLEAGLVFYQLTAFIRKDKDN